MVVRSDGDPALERLYSRRAACRASRLPATTARRPAGRTTASPATAPSWSSCPAAPCAARRASPRSCRARARPSRRAPAGGASSRSRSGRSAARRCAATRDATTASTTSGCGDPQVIVQHYTATDTFALGLQHFATDAPDPELGELPGVCAHFVIDRDGTIYRLVPTSIMCRHTVGLNWTAIGIEHVGRSDAQVLGNRRQLRRLAAADPHAAGPLRHHDPERDRAQREPREPLPPRARGAAAQPDPRRHDPRDDGRATAACSSASRRPTSMR